MDEAEAEEMEEITDAICSQKRSRITDLPQELEIHKKQREEVIPMVRDRTDSQTKPNTTGKRNVIELQEHNRDTPQHSKAQSQQQKQGQSKQAQGSQSQCT